VLEGRFPAYEGVDALYSPRRTVLDALLVDAARAAGAEVWEDVQVREVIAHDGVVTGVSCIAPGRTSVTASGHLVIGADGKHSTIARAAHAEAYRATPASSVACYGYWSGLPLEMGELYQRAGLAAAAFPTPTASWAYSPGWSGRATSCRRGVRLLGYRLAAALGVAPARSRHFLRPPSPGAAPPLAG
jgi:2-polyprenyl-6-methoxyphenol hydroxylase-like FAD-dependent oxidoreductase